MARGFIEQPTASGENGSTLTNSTTAASIIPASRKITIPVPYFDDIGDVVEIYAAGALSTAAATPGTLTFDVRFGSTVVFNGGASGTLATSASSLTWELFIQLQCTTIGTSATVKGTGHLITAALSATTPIMLLPTSAPANGTAFDATASQTVDLFATFSVASASNILICHKYQVRWVS
jgi:hypothetical protein